MIAPSLNHRPPPARTLADELNRFDRTLDRLAEALNESIAHAAREGGRLVMREAVAECATEFRTVVPTSGPSPPALAAVRPCPAMAEPARGVPLKEGREESGEFASAPHAGHDIAP
jgi:hypothetical protein